VTSVSQTELSELRCELAPDSRIKMIGLGGVGCIAVRYLSLYLNSLRRPMRLVLIDGDTFETKNAQRMHFNGLGNKAELKAEEILNSLESSELTVVPVPEFVSEENIERLILPGDHVFLCVDNHQTRRLVAERCAELSDVALFSGGNDGVEPPDMRGTYGNVQVHIRRDGSDLTAPITRFHPEIAKAEGELPTGMDCGQMAVSSPQILFANLAAAGAMLNAFFAYTCGELSYQEVTFDILEGKFLPQFPVEAKPSPLPTPA